MSTSAITARPTRTRGQRRASLTVGARAPVAADVRRHQSTRLGIARGMPLPLSLRNALFVAVALVFASTSVYSHPGGLDKCGGHRYKKKGGGYHIHDDAKFCACYPKNKRCTDGKAAALKPKAGK